MDDVSDDFDLLRRYVERGCDHAFATLVRRHADMVYAVARRRLGPGGAADEVTQATFILLMRKADRLPRGTVIAGWLYKAAGYAAANARRAEVRRRKHERKAADMATNARPDCESWGHVAPHLDEAIAGLSALDRSAVVLRFLERRSMAEVGRSLGVSEHAAQMRVSRALDKLRHYFGRRGVTLSAGALGVLIWSHTADAAPVSVRRLLDVATLKAAAGPHAGHVLAERLAYRELVGRATRMAACVVGGGVALCLLTTAAHLTADRLTRAGSVAGPDVADRLPDHVDANGPRANPTTGLTPVAAADIRRGG